MLTDECRAANIRHDLGDLPGLSEKRVFGTHCFMRDGNVICGANKDGGLFRVGKAQEARAVRLPGVGPAILGGRLMGGYVQTDHAALDNDDTRGRLTQMALAFVATLTPK